MPRRMTHRTAGTDPAIPAVPIRRISVVDAPPLILALHSRQLPGAVGGIKVLDERHVADRVARFVKGNRAGNAIVFHIPQRRVDSLGILGARLP